MTLFKTPPLRRVLVLLTASLALGSITTSGAPATNAGKFRVVITESGSVYPLGGTFVLTDPAGNDSGTSVIGVNIGPALFRDGQSYEIHSGKDSLIGKKGGLTLSFSGVSVNAGTYLYIEYGTWHITAASGVYKGWKGSGRWAGTDNKRSTAFNGKGSSRPDLQTLQIWTSAAPSAVRQGTFGNTGAGSIHPARLGVSDGYSIP